MLSIRITLVIYPHNKKVEAPPLFVEIFQKSGKNLTTHKNTRIKKLGEFMFENEKVIDIDDLPISSEEKESLKDKQDTLKATVKIESNSKKVTIKSDFVIAFYRKSQQTC